MKTTPSKLLLAAAVFCAAAALGHVGCIIFGGEWYRFFGAGEQMARMSERGDWYPAMVTAPIVVALSLWSFYALSGAGFIRRLPLLRVGLVIIASIFIIRAISFVVLMPMFPENSLTFWLISSAICLLIGMCFAIGTYQSWGRMTKACR